MTGASQRNSETRIAEFGMKDKTVGVGPVLSAPAASFDQLRTTGWGVEGLALPKEGAASSAPANSQSAF